MITPTIKITSTHPRGWVIINESDFDPAVHELFTDTPKPDPLTREAVAAMEDKATLIELIKAHGGEADARKGLDTLRADLTKLMFVDI